MNKEHDLPKVTVKELESRLTPSLLSRYNQLRMNLIHAQIQLDEFISLVDLELQLYTCKDKHL